MGTMTPRMPRSPRRLGAGVVRESPGLGEHAGRAPLAAPRER